MKTFLTALACVGLSASAATACEYQRSVQARIDQTVVASIATETAGGMSEPVLIIQEQPAPKDAPDAGDR